jgi:hypothetical protein
MTALHTLHEATSKYWACAGAEEEMAKQKALMRQRLLRSRGEIGNTVTRRQVAAPTCSTNQPTFTVEQFGEMEFRGALSSHCVLSVLFLWCFLRELAASPIFCIRSFHGEFHSILRFFERALRYVLVSKHCQVKVPETRSNIWTSRWGLFVALSSTSEDCIHCGMCLEAAVYILVRALRFDFGRATSLLISCGCGKRQAQCLSCSAHGCSTGAALHKSDS